MEGNQGSKHFRVSTLRRRSSIQELSTPTRPRHWGTRRRFCQVASIALTSAASTLAAAQSDSGPLSSMLQIGSRIVRSSAADVLEVRVIIPPDLRVYAPPRMSLELLGIPANISVPSPTVFKTVDGSTHEVYAGSVTITASFRKGMATCGRPVLGRLTLQGCTASLCFAPEQIALSAMSSTC